MKKTKNAILKERRERLQLKWMCLRLSDIYRKECDEHEDNGEYDWFVPNYKYLDFREAILKADPSLKNQQNEKCAIRMEEIVRTFGGTCFVDYPESIVDSLDGGEKYLMYFDDSDPMTFMQRLTDFYSSEVCIKINLDARKEHVLKIVDDVFERIVRYKKKHGIKNHIPKVGSIKDALMVYELKRHEGVPLSKIAKDTQSKAETYAGAYNRVKKRYEFAKKLVDGFMHRSI